MSRDKEKINGHEISLFTLLKSESVNRLYLLESHACYNRETNNGSKVRSVSRS